MHHAQSVPEPPQNSSLPSDIVINRQKCAKKHSTDVESSSFFSSEPSLTLYFLAKEEWNTQAYSFYFQPPPNLAISFRCKKPWTTGNIDELCQAAIALKEILVGQLWLSAFPFSDEEKNQLVHQSHAAGKTYEGFIALLNDLLDSITSSNFSILAEQYIIFSYLKKLIAVEHQLEAVETALTELLTAFRQNPALQAASHLISIFKLMSSQIAGDTRDLALYLSARQDAYIHQLLHAGEAL